jgi:hypothetical protein
MIFKRVNGFDRWQAGMINLWILFIMRLSDAGMGQNEPTRVKTGLSERFPAVQRQLRKDWLGGDDNWHNVLTFPTGH